MLELKSKNLKLGRKKFKPSLKNNLQINFTLSKFEREDFFKKKIPQHWLRPFPIIFFLILVIPVIFLIIPIGYHRKIDKMGITNFLGELHGSFLILIITRILFCCTF